MRQLGMCVFQNSLKIAASVLMFGSTLLSKTGEIKIMNSDLLQSSKTCILVPAPSAGDDFRGLCNGKIAVLVEGYALGFDQMRKFYEHHQLLSIMVDILYRANFFLTQGANNNTDLSGRSIKLFVKN